MCVLAFSTVDRDSFVAVEQWKQKVFLSSPSNISLTVSPPLPPSQVEAEVGEIVMCIVQNKIDLIDEAVMTP